MYSSFYNQLFPDVDTSVLQTGQTCNNIKHIIFFSCTIAVTIQERSQSVFFFSICKTISLSMLYKFIKCMLKLEQKKMYVEAYTERSWSYLQCQQIMHINGIEIMITRRETKSKEEGHCLLFEVLLNKQKNRARTEFNHSTKVGYSDLGPSNKRGLKMVLDTLICIACEPANNTPL